MGQDGERPGATSSWERPAAGRKVSGVAALLARKLDAPVGLLRFAFLADALLGALLALGFSTFDHVLLDGGAAPGPRTALIVLGLLGVLVYPTLALLLPEEGRARRWDFGSAAGAVLLFVLVGQAVGFLLGPYWDYARTAWHVRGPPGLLTWVGTYLDVEGLSLKEPVLLLFFLSSASFLFLQRRAVVVFFRSVHVGVTLVVTCTIAVTIGVLVPQIDGFEDPDQRVDMVAEARDLELFREFGYQRLPRELEDGHEQYQAFRWAEGYFLYHLLHLYGIGMPTADLPPSVEEGLERFGDKYGREEEKNNRKQMRAMLSGREKIDEIGSFIHRNEETLWRAFQVCTALELNRAYKSSWFAALLMLLGCSIFSSAYKNWSFRRERLPGALVGGLVAVLFVVVLRALGALVVPYGDLLLIALGFMAVAAVLGPGVPKSAVSLQKLGFFVVHNGLLLLLIGGGTSKLFTDRGILQLDLRDEAPQDVYYRFFDVKKRARMPFAVKLDHFARRDWLALQVLFPEEEFTSEPPRYTLWEGRRIALDYVDDGPDGTGGERADLDLEVLSLHDQVEVGLMHASEATGEDAEGGRPFPLAEVLVDGATGDGRVLILPLRGPSASLPGEVVRDPEGDFRLAGVVGPNPERVFPPQEGRIGVVEATVIGAGAGQPRVVPVTLEEEVELDGGYRLRFVDATKEFRFGEDSDAENLHPLPLAGQPVENPALWVDLIPPDDGEVERRLVFERFDDVEFGRQETHFHRNVLLRFRLDRWSAPGPPRFLLHWGDGVEPGLIGQDGQRWTAVPGEPLPLPSDRGVVPRQLLRNAVLEKNLTFIDPLPGADGWEADFYAQAPRGVVLRVTRHRGTPREWSEDVELATTDSGNANLWVTPESDVILRFLENSEMLPYEWRSVLSIFERDDAGNLTEVPLGSEREREIRVNDYLYYEGFRFFQTNADPRMPTYSGIGVVYDPGIPLVLIGMYAIIAGAAIAFLVRPIVRGAG
jgi:hypothetical protein